jgi:hypothetical protein
MPVGQMVSQEMVSTKEEFQVINRWNISSKKWIDTLEPLA